MDISKTAIPGNKALSGAATLVKLLPSTAFVAFQSLDPFFTNNGACYMSNRYLTLGLIGFCTVSSVFFAFTDSLVGDDGKHYYGLATSRGFYVFNYNGTDQERNMVFRDLSRLRLRMLDYIHAFFSVLMFLALAFSDTNVQSCFFLDAGPEQKQLAMNVPLGVGFLSCMVFFTFPSTRKGIGYSGTTPPST